MNLENALISQSWNFGDDKELADKLKNLVLSGKKTATTGFYKENGTPSRVGDFQQILDSDGTPFCTIQITKVEVKPFLDVDFGYAKLEGEGEKDIEEWRESHRKFFSKYYPDFSDNSSVVCVIFSLVSQS